METAGYGNNELPKNVVIGGLNFICSNLPDGCNVEFTHHARKRKKLKHHSFTSEAKSSNVLPIPEETGSTSGLPPQIDFITSKYRYNIL